MARSQAPIAKVPRRNGQRSGLRTRRSLAHHLARSGCSQSASEPQIAIRSTLQQTTQQLHRNSPTPSLLSYSVPVLRRPSLGYDLHLPIGSPPRTSIFIFRFVFLHSFARTLAILR